MNDLILFDGVCNFCNSAVNFVINHDSKGRYRFASLQSDYAQKLLRHHNAHTAQALDTVVLISDGKLYKKSAAVLQIARHLRGWSWLTWFGWVPTPVQDVVYDLIARNRYRIFGKSTTCQLPTPDQKSRFVG